MSKDAPGFDFITLTKSQWRWLKTIERDHGIPWYIYISSLIKADMEGRLVSKPKRKKPITKGRLEEILEKIDVLLNRPAPRYIAPPKEGQANFDAVFDEEVQVKPSRFVETTVDPNKLANGASARDLRSTFMDELHEVLGLEPLEQKRKAMIEFGSHIQVTGAPDPPKVIEK